MPSSQSYYIPDVLELIHGLPHRSILDVGPGFGKYGVLCREYFDLIPTWFEKGLSGFDQRNWQLRIDCIEPFEEYITPLHKYIYDNIYLGKAEDLIDEIPNYDLILILGVIEHLEKGVGLNLLKKYKDKTKAIVLVTPNGFHPQGPEWNNPLEEHKSGWTVKDLEGLDFKCSPLPPGNKIIAYYKGS